VTLEKRTSPTDDAVNRLRERMLELGWNVQVAAHDGEELASRLARDGVVDAVLTDDTDVLAFGSPVTYARVGKLRQLHRITLSTALEALQLSHAQFVDLAVLMGSDYTASTLPGVGVKTAYKLIREHGSIDEICAALPPAKRRCVSTGDFNYQSARKIFVGEV